jgi:hypothetical protein
MPSVKNFVLMVKFFELQLPVKKRNVPVITLRTASFVDLFGLTKKRSRTTEDVGPILSRYYQFGIINEVHLRCALVAGLDRFIVRQAIPNIIRRTCTPNLPITSS